MKFIVAPTHFEKSILNYECPTHIPGCVLDPGCNPNTCLGRGLCFTYCHTECYYHNCTRVNTTSPGNINNSK